MAKKQRPASKTAKADFAQAVKQIRKKKNVLDEIGNTLNNQTHKDKTPGQKRQTTKQREKALRVDDPSLTTEERGTLQDIAESRSAKQLQDKLNKTHNAKEYAKHAAKDKTPDPTPEQLEQNLEAIKQEEEKELADADVFSQSDNGVPRTPDLIQLNCDHPKAPVSGQSHYFVISQTSHRVVLLHPFTLTQCTLPGDEIRGAKTVVLGEEQGMTGEKLASLMERLMKEYAARSKQYPEQIVRRLIAALRGQPIHEVITVKPKRDVPAQFKEKSARRPGVIDAIRERIEKPLGASKKELLAALLTLFPDRAEKGMAHTIDCQLRELPKKIAGVKVTVTEDKERGKVFRMVPA